MQLKTALLISLGYLKTLILKILNAHADTEHPCEQPTNTKPHAAVNCM